MKKKNLEKKALDDKKAAEGRKLVEERRLAEERKLGEERRLAEEKKLAEAQRFEKLKKLVQEEERKLAEAKRVKDGRLFPEERQFAEHKQQKPQQQGPGAAPTVGRKKKIDQELAALSQLKLTDNDSLHRSSSNYSTNSNDDNYSEIYDNGTEGFDNLDDLESELMGSLSKYDENEFDIYKFDSNSIKHASNADLATPHDALDEEIWNAQLDVLLGKKRSRFMRQYSSDKQGQGSLYRQGSMRAKKADKQVQEALRSKTEKISTPHSRRRILDDTFEDPTTATTATNATATTSATKTVKTTPTSKSNTGTFSPKTSLSPNTGFSPNSHQKNYANFTRGNPPPPKSENTFAMKAPTVTGKTAESKVLQKQQKQQPKLQ